MAGVQTPHRETLMSSYYTGKTLKAQLVDLGQYTHSLAHDALDDIPAGARIGSAVTLTGATYTGGVLDVSDFTVPGVTGVTVEAVAVYVSGASDALSPLITVNDQGTGLPFTPNGGDANVAFPTGIWAIETPA